MSEDVNNIKYAADCPPCKNCEEPWCIDCKDHYADCKCLGPDSPCPDDEDYECEICGGPTGRGFDSGQCCQCLGEH